MDKSIISTTNAPAAIGPYSQAVKIDGLVFTSGQLPCEASTGNIVSVEIVEQTKQALSNLEQVLITAGASLDTVLKTTVFIKNMGDFTKINEVYSTFFKQSFPSRSCVEVARLPKDALIEIEAVAYLK